MFRRSLLVAAATVMFVGLVSAPASADEPVVFTVPVDVVYQLVNPCTGLPIEVTFVDVTFMYHVDHLNNYVAKSVPSIGGGFTDDGYVMKGGGDVLTASFNSGAVVWNTPLLFRNPDTGSVFRQNSLLVRFLTEPEPRVLNVELVCLNPGR